ncbi:MAG: ABC transporter permease [Anaerolineales bacterium]
MSGAATQAVGAVTRIQPSKAWSWAELGDLWRYRELVYFLVWRDVKVRYKQTLLGAGWAILKPFLSMVIFTLVFAGLAGLETDGAPAPVFYYAGLLPWVLFQDGVSKAGNSLVTGSHLITKVYFPRLAIPLASVAGGVVDFALALLVLFGLMAFYRVPGSASLATIPLFLGLALTTAMGAGLWLSALNVSYRDVGYVTPFLLQAWLYASPIAYSVAIIPEGTARMIYALNPMAGVVQGFRWAVLGTGRPAFELLLISTAVAVALLVSGALYFRRMERTFADVV